MGKAAFTVLIILLAIASAIAGAVIAIRQSQPSPVMAIWEPQQATGGFSANSGGFDRNRMAQFTAFRDEHKFTFQLQRIARGIQRLEFTAQPLTPAQAKAILAVLQPLRDQPKLTQEQAKTAMLAIQRTLTVEQRTAIAQPRRRGMGGGRMGGGMGGGFGGPGGAMGRPGQAPGQQRQFDPAAMKNFNPFAKDAPSIMPSGRGGGTDELFALLEERAGQRTTQRLANKTGATGGRP